MRSPAPDCKQDEPSMPPDDEQKLHVMAMSADHSEDVANHIPHQLDSGANRLPDSFVPPTIDDPEIEVD